MCTVIIFGVILKKSDGGWKKIIATDYSYSFYTNTTKKIPIWTFHLETHNNIALNNLLTVYYWNQILNNNNNNNNKSSEWEWHFNMDAWHPENVVASAYIELILYEELNRCVKYSVFTYYISRACCGYIYCTTRVLRMLWPQLQQRMNDKILFDIVTYTYVKQRINERIVSEWSSSLS